MKQRNLTYFGYDPEFIQIKKRLTKYMIEEFTRREKLLGINTKVPKGNT